MTPPIPSGTRSEVDAKAVLAIEDRLKAAIQAGAPNHDLLLAAWKALRQQTERVEAVEQGILSEVAALLNTRWSAIRWRFVETLNKRLEQRGCRFVLFEHGGHADVGELAASGTASGEETP